MAVNLVSQIIGLLFVFVFQFSCIEYFDPCTHHNGIPEKEVEALFKDWPNNLNLASVNRTHKCYVTCILLYYQLVGTSGEIMLDKYFDSGVIDEYAFAPIMGRCLYEYREETDFCEHTFGLFNCFRQERLLSSDYINKQ
ncbi:general odorant-binding protein 57d [Drosophila takahashii]|uniref:general odorant-binding protein 57d n=1 Tax=Drosophila takahashii TaxID=29030 RepID=UPI0007E8121F|nr:general odorant-binding protein 57d [Drosophila takahashii]